MGLKNEFEIAVVNEPSVFEPLKFYCTLDNSKTRTYCGYSRCGWGLFGYFGFFFLSPIISLIFLPLSWRRLNIDRQSA